MPYQNSLFIDPIESEAVTHARAAIKHATHNKKKLEIVILQAYFEDSLELANTNSEKFTVCLFYMRALKRIFKHYYSLSDKSRVAYVGNDLGRLHYFGNLIATTAAEITGD